MSPRTYLAISASIFALIAIAHLARLAIHFPVVIGSWNVPMWVSIFGVVVPGGLAWQGFRLAREGGSADRW